MYLKEDEYKKNLAEMRKNLALSQRIIAERNSIIAAERKAFQKAMAEKNARIAELERKYGIN